ncbi:NUDIX hydrolase [Streptomyces cyaneofuscatus]|uniref:NUDIX hydrolase n=1 Tax=Streptomyces cyaneofuscatus TaxID=66883 RepID=UPI0036512645
MELVEHVDEQDQVVGQVSRRDAVQGRLLYRMAMVLVRDKQGRILVHRRPESSPRFPGQYSWLVAGAVAVGESYEAAASRELAEELGLRGTVRPLFKFLCEGEMSPYWFSVFESVVDGEHIVAEPAEVAWHGWLTDDELEKATQEWPFVSDSRDAYARYRDLGTSASQPRAT